MAIPIDPDESRSTGQQSPQVDTHVFGYSAEDSELIVPGGSVLETEFRSGRERSELWASRDPTDSGLPTSTRGSSDSSRGLWGELGRLWEL